MEKKEKTERLVIEKNNIVYIALFLLFVVLTVLICTFLSGKEDEYVRNFVLRMNILLLALLVPYRIYLLFDKEYIKECYGNAKNIYLYELPFYPCNIVEMMLPFALISGSHLLLAFCFFYGMLGPLLAIFFPGKGFESYSLLKPRMLGYYVTHYLCLMNIPLFLVGRIYRPVVGDVVQVTVIYAILSFFAFLLNNHINARNNDEVNKANYFYNSDPNFHPILNKSYEYIPHRYLFTIPLMALVAMAFILITKIIAVIIK